MRLRQQNDVLNQLRVSIHASVKDATGDIFAYWGGGVVSIHASVKDATQHPCVFQAYVAGFNPRICKRCDSKKIDSDPDHKFQSTHL